MAFTSQPLNNLKYTEHLTEMRQRWLTDTSISPAICLSEGGKRMGPSCMKKRALLISERRQRESEKEGWEIASSQFRFDEGHSVFSGWAVIYIMAKTSEATVKNVPWCPTVCTGHFTVTPRRLLVLRFMTKCKASVIGSLYKGFYYTLPLYNNCFARKGFRKWVTCTFCSNLCLPINFIHAVFTDLSLFSGFITLYVINNKPKQCVWVLHSLITCAQRLDNNIWSMGPCIYT